MDDNRHQGQELAPQLVTELSHALRTPLTSILVYAWLLADNPRKNLSAEEVGFATGIHHAGSAILHQIDHILDREARRRHRRPRLRPGTAPA
ncbi:histidine kinase dimerization/phospho-acceptor domain-containing protein [Actinoallomurus iriomotensis]|uniref:histidine kinase n=1 Tax=Actinoallomurus iriomotensis TaxID=478107 RepID=A0A9W6RJ74_9ACTN|nr:histidine kinase dimerization/phospho-acceptor domain-containing protein [Actinoallomurus iriomotensis]GLY76713.1 hypothetical protein Airi01_049800 [Actinoallomurus iriomotensis]